MKTLNFKVSTIKPKLNPNVSEQVIGTVQGNVNAITDYLATIGLKITENKLYTSTKDKEYYLLVDDEFIDNLVIDKQYKNGGEFKILKIDHWPFHVKIERLNGQSNEQNLRLFMNIQSSI